MQVKTVLEFNKIFNQNSIFAVGFSGFRIPIAFDFMNTNSFIKLLSNSAKKKTKLISNISFPLSVSPASCVVAIYLKCS